jgi:hypothetical protein
MEQQIDNTGLEADAPVHQPAADSIEGRLRAYGLADDQIEEIRRDIQRDLTRARQKDTGRLQTLEQEIQMLKSLLVHKNGVTQGEPTELPTAAVLRQHGITPERAKELYDALNASNNAVIEESVRRSIAALTPYLQTVTTAQQNAALEKEMNRLKQKFGKDVEPYLADIEAEARTRLGRGEGIRRLEDVFEDVNPEAYEDCVYRSRHRKLSTRQANANNATSSGFAQSRHAIPVNVGTTSKGVADKPILDSADIDRITNEALRAAGIR